MGEVWEERCLPNKACEWWFKGHEDKAHAIVADGPIDKQTGMCTNYPSAVIGIVTRLFNDTELENVFLVLEGFCPWHKDELQQGRCTWPFSDPKFSKEEFLPRLNWRVETDAFGTVVAGRWYNGVDSVSRRWLLPLIGKGKSQ